MQKQINNFKNNIAKYTNYKNGVKLYKKEKKFRRL